MVRVAEGGAAIDMEVWEVPSKHFGSFVDGIPAPLGIGKVKLADGTWVQRLRLRSRRGRGRHRHHPLGNWRAWLTHASLPA